MSTTEGLWSGKLFKIKLDGEDLILDCERNLENGGERENKKRRNGNDKSEKNERKKRRENDDNDNELGFSWNLQFGDGRRNLKRDLEVEEILWHGLDLDFKIWAKTSIIMERNNNNNLNATQDRLEEESGNEQWEEEGKADKEANLEPDNKVPDCEAENDYDNNNNEETELEREEILRELDTETPMRSLEVEADGEEESRYSNNNKSGSDNDNKTGIDYDYNKHKNTEKGNGNDNDGTDGEVGEDGDGGGDKMCENEGEEVGIWGTIESEDEERKRTNEGYRRDRKQWGICLRKIMIYKGMRRSNGLETKWTNGRERKEEEEGGWEEFDDGTWGYDLADKSTIEEDTKLAKRCMELWKKAKCQGNPPLFWWENNEIYQGVGMWFSEYFWACLMLGEIVLQLDGGQWICELGEEMKARNFKRGKEYDSMIYNMHRREWGMGEEEGVDREEEDDHEKFGEVKEGVEGEEGNTSGNDNDNNIENDNDDNKHIK